MKSLRRKAAFTFTALIALVVLHARAQSDQTAFFSFVNAINSTEPTNFYVEGKKIGDPFPQGFSTGGMGLLAKSANITVENGDAAKAEGKITLSPDRSPIVLAWLKVEPPPLGSNALPKKTIKLTEIPCSTAQPGARLRAIYIGGTDPLNLIMRKSSREIPASGTGVTLTLHPGTPVELPMRGSGPFEFLSGEERIAVHESEGSDNWLLVFFAGHEGKIGSTKTLDCVFH